MAKAKRGRAVRYIITCDDAGCYRAEQVALLGKADNGQLRLEKTILEQGKPVDTVVVTRDEGRVFEDLTQVTLHAALMNLDRAEELHKAARKLILILA